MSLGADGAETGPGASPADTPVFDRLPSAQYASAEMTSPMSRVEIAWKTPGFGMFTVFVERPLLMLFLMNLVLPSHIVALIPPG
jgi:hypothetical protein